MCLIAYQQQPVCIATLRHHCTPKHEPGQWRLQRRQCNLCVVAVQIVRELKTMAQALRPPRNRAKAVAAASISSAELDARGIPSGRPKMSATQVSVRVSILSSRASPRCLPYAWMLLPPPCHVHTGDDIFRLSLAELRLTAQQHFCADGSTPWGTS